MYGAPRFSRRARTHRYLRRHALSPFSRGMQAAGSCGIMASPWTSRPSTPCAPTTPRGGCCARIMRRWWRAFCTASSSQPNVRVMAAADLAEALEDELYALRERLGEGSFPKSALDYLNDWAGPDKGWLRKFYARDSDEPQFDLTPATEKAIAWLGTLSERSFVGTESRLLDPVRAAQADERGQRDRSRRSASRNCTSGATRSMPRSRGYWRATCRCWTTRR